MWYEDLTPCDYFGGDSIKVVRAIGWLERGRNYSTGTVSRECFDRLTELFKSPWQPVACMGPHSCDLCEFAPEALGSKNLFVPGNGFLYAGPELILHYINSHKYAPPSEFCDAVLNCPGCGTTEYRRLILLNGGKHLLNTANQHGV